MDDVMALQPNEIALRNDQRTNFRTEPFRLRFVINGLTTADQHEVNCIFECSSRVGDHPADQRLFSELLLTDRATVTREEIASHLRPALQAAAESAVAKPVATVLSESGRADVLQALRQAADAAAFNCGLAILPPFHLELTSPTLQFQQRQAAQRSRVEEEAANRLDHLRHAADLLKQFDSIRASTPSMPAGQVLERIAPADRGGLLNALLASNIDRAEDQTLFAVAGSQLLEIDPHESEIRPKLTELPTTLGPLRSVQIAEITGDRRLLVGARGGVLIVDPSAPQLALAYADPSLNSSLGFSSAIYLQETKSILATHAEAGLVQWDVADPSSPRIRHRAAELSPSANGSARNLLQIEGGSALLTIDACLIVVDGDRHQILSCESKSPIVSIANSSDEIFAVREDGSISTIDRESRQIVRTRCYASAICAAGTLPWMGGLRLLLATSSGPIDCVGTEDSLVTRFNSAYRGIKNVTGSARWIAAVSPDRQRLILWNSWDGAAPAHDLHLTSLTRHRIADIAFA